MILFRAGLDWCTSSFTGRIAALCDLQWDQLKTKVWVQVAQLALEFFNPGGKTRRQLARFPLRVAPEFGL